MAKKGWVGNPNEISALLKKGWVGNADNVACKIRKGWVGDENGIAQLIFDEGGLIDGIPDGYLRGIVSSFYCYFSYVADDGTTDSSSKSDGYVAIKDENWNTIKALSGGNYFTGGSSSGGTTGANTSYTSLNGKHNIPFSSYGINGSSSALYRFSYDDASDVIRTKLSTFKAEESVSALEPYASSAKIECDNGIAWSANGDYFLLPIITSNQTASPYALNVNLVLYHVEDDGTITIAHNFGTIYSLSSSRTTLGNTYIRATPDLSMVDIYHRSIPSGGSGFTYSNHVFSLDIENKTFHSLQQITGSTKQGIFVEDRPYYVLPISSSSGTKIYRIGEDGSFTLLGSIKGYERIKFFGKDKTLVYSDDGLSKIYVYELSESSVTLLGSFSRSSPIYDITKDGKYALGYTCTPPYLSVCEYAVSSNATGLFTGVSLSETVVSWKPSHGFDHTFDSAGVQALEYYGD